MALRGEDKNGRKLNRVGFRRSAGRTAEFFDLRETDRSTGKGRAADAASERRDGSYRYPDRTDESARPYRERHRVEVNANPQNDYFRYGEDFYGSGYGSGRGSSSYGGGQANGGGRPYGGSQSYGGGRSYGGSQPYGDGRSYDSSRIVRGNTPGSRTGKTEGPEEKELSSDLLYSGRDSRRSTGRENRASGRYRTDNYRSGSNSSYGSGSYTPYGRDRYSSYRNSREDSYEDFRDNSYEDPYEDSYRDSYEEDSYEEGYGGRGLPDEEAADRQAVLGRRLRQRAQGRRQREQELRALYVKIGIGAAVLLLAVIFIFPRFFRSGNSAKVSDGPQTAAQTQQDPGSREDQKETETSAEQAPAEEAPAGQADADGQKAGKGTEPEYVNTDEDAAAVSEQKDAQTAEAGGEQAENRTENKEAAAPDQKEAQTAQAGGEQAGNQAGNNEAAAPDQKEAQTAQAGGEQAQNKEAPAAENSMESTNMTAAESGKYAGQDDWRFILVNPWYMLPEGYDEVATSSIPNGESVDSRCYPEFVKMLDDCRAAGGQPVVCSSYRSHAKQVVLFDDQVKGLMAKGMKKQDAEAQAGTEVAVPGTSEHELGLAVDICDYKYQNLDDAQADTVTQKWLINHCWEYGFILRYPKNKTGITGIIYEPWHYRYVGKEAAKEITEKGICLEEYLEQ